MTKIEEASKQNLNAFASKIERFLNWQFTFRYFFVIIATEYHDSKH